MKKISANTKTEKYLVKFTVISKSTGLSEEKEEFAYSFAKEDFSKITKDIENKYRGKGYRVVIQSIVERN